MGSTPKSFTGLYNQTANAQLPAHGSPALVTSGVSFILTIPGVEITVPTLWISKPTGGKLGPQKAAPEQEAIGSEVRGTRVQKTEA